MKLKYPTVEQVEKASDLQIFKWYLLLPSPGTDEHIKILNMVCERCKLLGGITERIKKQILTGVKDVI